MIETMKILLNAINAKYIHSNLAVYSLRAYAKEYREHIRLLEYTINNRVEEILEGIYKEHADVICFSCYIWNIAYVKELIEELKKLCPNTPIWVGGPEVSYEIETLLAENPGIDGVFIGEGEHTFKKVCRCYIETEESEWEEELLRVSGIAYRKRDKTIAFTGMAEPVDMSTIPFCYEDMEQFKNKIIYYESSRGCPFSCSYCLSSIDKKMRFRDIELVKKELGFFIKQEVPQVKFVDRTFNCSHTHAMEIWRFIKEKDLGKTNFHFEVAADLLTEEELEYIAGMRPGLIQLEIGVQSTNDVTIQEIHRTMDLEKLKAVVRRIQAPGNIHQHLDLIAGLPYDFQRSVHRGGGKIVMDYAVVNDMPERERAVAHRRQLLRRAEHRIQSIVIRADRIVKASFRRNGAEVFPGKFKGFCAPLRRLLAGQRMNLVITRLRRNHGGDVKIMRAVETERLQSIHVLRENLLVNSLRADQVRLPAAPLPPFDNLAVFVFQHVLPAPAFRA